MTTESEARWRANGAFIDKPDPARVEQLEAVYEAALLHVGQFTPYALHTLDLRNALAAAQTKQDEKENNNGQKDYQKQEDA